MERRRGGWFVYNMILLCELTAFQSRIVGGRSSRRFVWSWMIVLEGVA